MSGWARLWVCGSQVRDFVTKALVPYMESRVCGLNQQVTATRKGLKNQLRSLWWRKERRDGDDATGEGGPMYAADAPELQLRALADLAYLVQDYELAATNYRAAAAEFKADKAWRRLAAAHEAMAVATFMAAGPRREVEAALDAAFTTYSRCAQTAAEGSRRQMLRFATRCMLLMAAMWRAQGLFREATVPLMRASYEETPLRAALLLEQAALCYLQASPPLLRKFAFYMVLAGHRYNHAGQRWHAVRAYAAVLAIYRAHGWVLVEEHLHFALGRQVAHIGHLGHAVDYFVALLGSCAHQPAALQATYVREFLYVVQCACDSTKDDAAAPDVVPLPLPLPHLALDRVQVHFRDHRCYAAAADAQVAEDEWAALEAPLLPVGPSDAPTWLELAGKARDTRSAELNTCVAGEAVEVDIEVSNPLQVPLEVTRLRLVCGHTPPSGEGASAAAFDAVEAAVNLQPGERRTLRLSVVPHCEGTLQIQAVEWTLCGVASGRKAFPVRAAPEEGQILRRVPPPPPPHRRLDFRVVAVAPRLEARLEGLPATVLHGQLQRCTLRLVNVGPAHAALHHLKLNCSDGALLCGRIRGQGVAAEAAYPAKGAECAFEFPAAITLEGGGSWDTSAMASAAADEGMASGAHLQWPLWIRPTASGPLALRVVLYYEPRMPSTSVLQYRVLRLRTAVHVLPSLRVAAAAAPTASHATRQLLRVEVQNLAAVHALSLRHMKLLPPPNTPAALPSAPQSTRAAAAAAAASASASASASAAATQPPLELTLSPLLGTPRPTADVHGGVPVQPLASLSLLLHAAAAATDLRPAEEQVGGGIQLEAGAACALSLSQALSADSALSWPLQQFHRRQRRAELATGECAGDRGRGGAAACGSQQGDWRADLVLLWEAAQHADAGSERCVGVHYACGVKLEGAATVRCTLVGPSRVAHDFSDAALCCVALTLRITNGSQDAVAVRVRAPPSDSGECRGSAAARTTEEAAGSGGGLMPTMSSFQAPMQSMGEALWVGCTCQVRPPHRPLCSSARGVTLALPAPPADETAHARNTGAAVRSARHVRACAVAVGGGGPRHAAAASVVAGVGAHGRAWRTAGGRRSDGAATRQPKAAAASRPPTAAAATHRD